MDGENRIVLNVGGIRFETYKVSWSIFNEIHRLDGGDLLFLGGG